MAHADMCGAHGEIPAPCASKRRWRRLRTGQRAIAALEFPAFARRPGTSLRSHERSSGPSMSKKKIVLYQPQQVDSSIGPPSSGDMLPLEMLTIGAYPDRDGYEIVIVDGSLYAQDEAHRRVLEACEGAMLYATTGILG